MKLLSTPRRLLTLDALFARREPVLDETDEAQDTRMPDELELRMLQALAQAPQPGRIAAEVALEEGGRRQYAPRDESQVLEFRRERRS